MVRNSTVILLYFISGQQLSYGVYEYKERTTSGKIIEENQRLFTINKPEYSNCFKKVHLGTSFVNNAISIESRPKRDEHFKAYVYWKTMSEEERLHYHIQKYVDDNNALDYNYTILYEE